MVIYIMTLCVLIEPDATILFVDIPINNENHHGKLLNEKDPRITFAGQVGDGVVVCKSLYGTHAHKNPFKFYEEVDDVYGKILLVKMDGAGEPQDISRDEFERLHSV